jgi:hypothetical protein
LLNDSIYPKGKAPTEVAGKLFVYEIVEVSDDGKVVTVDYQKQVICEGGDQFILYDDGDDQEVSFLGFLRNIAIPFSHQFVLNSTKVHRYKGTHRTGSPRTLVPGKCQMQYKDTGRTGACYQRTAG